ncbi:Eukaryotic translation initiation factor 4 gamma 3 [Araneus ventricosus]|uniref:Eukaryotic translation initiation factor 4 gamma 3 n=1 Tax=Araneus ventricosus TaxID=182803 RepID=A0A4Y2LY93_ARAVE|nr:Eukaryotic translation initiation factor 4 gamma 3 [Araneus ventricosus]
MLNSVIARGKEASESATNVTTSLGQALNLNASENVWKPLSRSQQSIEEKENLKRKVQAVLNKLTFQKFKILLSQLKKLNIDSLEALDLVAELIYENAIYEPYFCVLYANLCKQLVLKMPFVAQPDQHADFHALLLSKCIRGFDEKFSNFKQGNEDLQPQDNEERMKLKTRWIGNMRFIGELYKFNLIETSVILGCADILLKQEDEDSLECFCWLMKTAGKELENCKDLPEENPVDKYFAQIQKIIDSRLTSTRIRFLLQDIIDLRQSDWIPRRIENRPRTIDEIRKEAALEAQKQMQMYHKVVSSNTSACSDQSNATCHNSCLCDHESNKSSESTKVNCSALRVSESEAPSEVKNLLVARGWKGKKKNYNKRKSQNNRNQAENKNDPSGSSSRTEL